jgi:hypothetical protein
MNADRQAGSPVTRVMRQSGGLHSVAILSVLASLTQTLLFVINLPMNKSDSIGKKLKSGIAQTYTESIRHPTDLSRFAPRK